MNEQSLHTQCGSEKEGIISKGQKKGLQAFSTEQIVIVGATPSINKINYLKKKKRCLKYH